MTLTGLQIAIYEPACLIVGTRGRSLGGIQGLLPGSVSKYCLQNSPVPVIVVRPSAKREKKKRKRKADPARQAYMDILQRGGATGSHVLDSVAPHSQAGSASEEANETEARAVAKAIGLPSSNLSNRGSRRTSLGGESIEGAPLTKVISSKSGYSSGPESPSPIGGMSPDSAFEGEMMSPESANLESPEFSGEEEGNVENSPARPQENERETKQ